MGVIVAEPNAKQDPSMEEILASIRRIISEDGGEAPVANSGAAAPALAANGSGAGHGKDADVLELTEIIEEEKSEAAIKADVVPPAPNGSIAQAMAAAAAKAAAAPVAMEAEPAVPAEPAPRKESAMAETSQSSAPVITGEARERLVSSAAQEATARAFGALSASLDAARGPAGMSLGQGNRTLEDLVRELLKPMLKDWLEANLPGVVDRLVQKEIREMVRRAEDR
jgi:cell pole-organizing protein PopZ